VRGSLLDVALFLSGRYLLLLWTLGLDLRRKRLINHLHLPLRRRVVRIDLRRLAVGMPQKLLNRPQRLPGRRQPSRERTLAGRNVVGFAPMSAAALPSLTVLVWSAGPAPPDSPWASHDRRIRARYGRYPCGPLGSEDRAQLGGVHYRTQPAILLAQFARAVDTPGIGDELLSHAVDTVHLALAYVGATVLVVDPFDEDTAQMWRERFGFQDSQQLVPGDPGLYRLWFSLQS